MTTYLYAILSDIHANYDALEAVEKDARTFAIKIKEEDKALEDMQGPRFVCLGDIVDYGPQPNECMDWRNKVQPMIVIRGNHDDEASKKPWIKPSRVDEKFWPITVWTRLTLHPSHRDALQTLDEVKKGSDDLEEFLLFHTHPDGKDIGISNNFTAARVLASLGRQDRRYGLFGHTHFQGMFVKLGRRAMAYWSRPEQAPESDNSLPVNQWHPLPKEPTLLNPGSVGQPRFHPAQPQSDDHAAYMFLLNHPQEGWKFQWRRVKYPVRQTIELLRGRRWPREEAEKMLQRANNHLNHNQAARIAPHILTAKDIEALEQRFPDVLNSLSHLLESLAGLGASKVGAE